MKSLSNVISESFCVNEAVKDRDLKKFSSGNFLDTRRDWKDEVVVDIMVDGDNAREYYHQGINWLFDKPLNDNDVKLINKIAKEYSRWQEIDDDVKEDWSDFFEGGEVKEPFIVSWFSKELDFVYESSYQGPIEHDEEDW